MKNIFLSLSAVVALSVSQVRAEQPNVAEVNLLLNQVSRAEIVQSAKNIINWQVGDYQKITIKLSFGSGAGTKEANAEDTGMNAVWMTTNISLFGQAQKTEALISRTDGKLLKLLVNGKEETVEDQEVEILEQAETTVTVPAGTFDCIYVRANITSDGKTQEAKIWANPIDVNLDGTLKMVMQSQFGDITLTLNEFGHH